MKHILGIIFTIVLFIVNSIFIKTQAQTQPQLSNGNLENWTSVGPYENPTDWSSLNILTSVFAPVTVTKTTDAAEGMYAARLETQDFFGNIIPGIIYLGTFDTGLGASGLIAGVPFAGGQPNSISGYYKYISVNNDSAAVVAQLWGFNPILGKRDTIAEAAVVFYQTTNQYAPFDIPFTYNSNQIPDSISVVATSSAGGAVFLGAGGSTLYVDGLQLNYAMAIEPSALNTNNPPYQITFQSQTNHLQFATTKAAFPANTQLWIYTLNGQQIANFSLHNQQHEWPLSITNGLYVWYVTDANRVLASGRLAAKF